MIGSRVFAFSPTERVALDTVREGRPEIVALCAWLAEALDDLVRTSQGRIVRERDADDLSRGSGPSSLDG